MNYIVIMKKLLKIGNAQAVTPKFLNSICFLIIIKAKLTALPKLFMKILFYKILNMILKAKMKDLKTNKF